MSSVTIGLNTYRGTTKPVTISAQDRLRHMYMIGKTGVGKSSLYQSMCLQDIQNGNGVCFIDPHGESIDWLMARIPTNRLEDVVLFDPSDTEFPVGLNLLDGTTEEEKDFLVNETIGIFYKLFDPDKTGVIGPQFEHWLRNAALTIMSGSGGTLLEIPRLFTDPRFEYQKRQSVTDPVVLEFWSKQMARTSDYHRSEMLNYFTSKFGHFSNNQTMRLIMGQKASSINIEHIINSEKILLINLSKGKIGDLNARALGLIITAKIQAAIMKRAGLPPAQRYPFYLYVDEFHNVVTDTFASMLSESRKYGLGVHLTNQYFSQLPESMRDAILGNIGTLLAFEIGMDDAETLAKEFEPLEVEDFARLPRFHFFIKLMIEGKTSKPFSAHSMQLVPTELSINAEKIRTISRLAYGSPKILIDYEQQAAAA
jgi:type IV secretory pathway TraG/TraD family ATPase VirD4